VKSLRQYITESGWDPSGGDIVHAFVGGSELHGAKVEGTDDHDIYGVYIEAPARALGIDAMDHSHQHFVWSTAGTDRRNTADDVDITLFSLQKWAYLACKGNVTKLHFLFAQPDPELTLPVWERILARRPMFLAKSHLHSFLHFAEDQFARLTGEKGRGKKGQRPELELKFGYDTKAAMHTLRILHEAEELLLHGTLTLPGPYKDDLIRIRKGEWTLEQVEKQVNDMKRRCTEAQGRSPLREAIDRAAVSALVADCYRTHWQQRR
jgi:uncharacterized protein